MGTDSITKGVYITCVHDAYEPYGRMCNSYHTEDAAREHIRFQKEDMGSKASWSILHIKDCEWIDL